MYSPRHTQHVHVYTLAQTCHAHTSQTCIGLCFIQINEQQFSIIVFVCAQRTNNSFTILNYNSLALNCHTCNFSEGVLRKHELMLYVVITSQTILHEVVDQIVKYIIKSLNMILLEHNTY